MMQETLKKLCPQLSEKQLEQFETYYELLVDWNTRMNLTAITEEEDVAVKHFKDSLLGSDCIPNGAKCVDVGTGAGFPGIPLLILREDIHVTLLDSLNKRLTFLQEVIDKLGLGNRAMLVHDRAEDAGQNPKYRGKFDVALSRAVAGLSVLLELTIPFLNEKGQSICYKGDSEEEIENSKNACRELNCKVFTKDVTSDYGKRTLVIAQRIGTLNKKYPRKAGTPSKNPL